MWQCQSCLSVWEAPRGELEPSDVVLENCIPSTCRRCASRSNTAAPTFAQAKTPPPQFLDTEECRPSYFREDASAY